MDWSKATLTRTVLIIVAIFIVFAGRLIWQGDPRLALKLGYLSLVLPIAGFGSWGLQRIKNQSWPWWFDGFIAVPFWTLVLMLIGVWILRQL
jgi:hypothetical protein